LHWYKLCAKSEDFIDIFYIALFQIHTKCSVLTCYDIQCDTISFPCHSTIADDSDQMEEHASVKQLKMNTEQGGAVTLEECFEVMVLIQMLM
jgi:hypothetical protein